MTTREQALALHAAGRKQVAIARELNVVAGVGVALGEVRARSAGVVGDGVVVRRRCRLSKEVSPDRGLVGRGQMQNLTRGTAMTTIHEVLYRAGDMVIERGLYKKDCGHTGVCTLTSIHHAADGDERLEMAAYFAFVQHMGMADAAVAVEWNDAPERTPIEVATALRTVATVAEAQAIIAAASEVDVRVVTA